MSIIKKEPVLRIYSQRSVLCDEDGNEFVFEEGIQSADAKKRLANIKAKLEDGYFSELINGSSIFKV